MRCRFIVVFAFSTLLTLFISTPVLAQQPITGAPPLSTIAGGGFDVVDLANLDVHLSIPVFSRPGKGMPFSYNLTYDSLIWAPATSGGSTTWTPASNWGWAQISTANTGYVVGPRQLLPCYQNGKKVGNEFIYGPFTYYDASGTSHFYDDYLYHVTPGVCTYGEVDSFTDTARDNSGLQLSVEFNSGYTPVSTVKTPSGVTISLGAAAGNGTITDPNGNTITVTGGLITDTLGTTALTVSNTFPPSNVTYTYTAPSGAAAVTVSYGTYSVATNFGVSGIGEYCYPNGCTAYLVNQIALPDGSKYTFSYENTAGLSGKVTGRIASVTLPTGGTITYGYGSGNSMMTDGSPTTLTRNLGGGVWTYSRTPNPTLPQVWAAVTDPAGNVTDTYFSGTYLTAKSVYAGARVTNLDYSYICYNGNQTNCPTASVAAPVNSRVVYDYPSYGSLYSYSSYSYDSYGSLVGQTDYDFGTTSHNTLRSTTVVNSAKTSASNHSLCTSYNICNAPASVQITDGSNQKSYTTYTYDQGGNTHGSPTTVSRWTGGSSYLNQGYTYNSGGTVATATDPNGTTTTYTYNSGVCNGASPTSVTVAGLTTSYQYDSGCKGAVVTQVTDPNNAITTAAYTDSFFWRPASTTDPLNNTTSYFYYPVLSKPGQVEAVMTFNSGQSTNDVIATPDTLGRPYLQQKRQSPGSTNFDTVDTEYDSTGRVYSTTQPFTCGLGQGQGSCAAYTTTTTYDAANRPLQVRDAAGGTTSYSYNLNDVYVTLGPAPSGENSKRRQSEYDALGRLRSVCEITTGSGTVACSQNTGGATGYFTSYGFDPLGNLTSANQSGQTRSFMYDGLARLTREVNPESGTTQYFWDAAPAACGSPGWATPGDVGARLDNAGAYTCYGYDALHRVLGFGHATGTSCTGFQYDNSYTPPAGATVQNTKGRLLEAYTNSACNGHASIVTDTWFSYSPRGEPTDTWESYLHSGGWFHTQQSYFPNGEVSSLEGFMGTGTTTPFSELFTYGLDGEGRRYSVTGSQSSTILSSTTYNAASQPTGVNLLDGGEGFSYNPYTGRMTQWRSTAGSLAQTGTLTWNANGTLRQLGISDNYNPSNVQTCTYGYDDLARLTSVGCGAPWSQTFTYDPFGNINKSGSSNFQATYNGANQVVGSGFTYDGVGNVTQDNLGNVFSYDFEGRPVTVASVPVIYDAFGRVAEPNNAGAIVYTPTGQAFSWGGPSYWVPLVAGMQARFSSGAFQFYRHVDWLGTSRFDGKAAGTAYYDGAFAPFGEQYANSGFDDFFTGQNPNVKVGLLDFPLREYSTSQGRWLVPDPAGLTAVDPTNPQTWNRYAYVANNPLSNVDPLGLDAQCTTDANGNTTCSSNVTAYPSWWAFVYQGGPFQSWSNMACMLMGGCSYSSGSSGGGGGGGGGGTSQPQPNPNTLNKVVNSVKNAVTTAVCFGANATGLTSLPGMTNSTVGFGLGGSAGVGVYAGISVNAGAQAVADQQGNVGLAITFGGNPGQGVWAFGAMGGAQAMKSNAATIYDLRGFGASVGGGVGVGSAAGSFDFSASGSSWAGTFTVGVGVGPVGHSAGANISKTWVPLSVNCQ